MTRSSKHYRAPTRVRRPNHLPVIFNTARLRSASPRVRRLARTVLRVYVYCLLLLLAARSCVQVIGHTAEALTTLAIDPNQSNLSLASDQSPDECPLTEVIDDCRSSLFGKWAWHGPGDCDVDCPQVAVNVSVGHLNTFLIGVQLQDTLQNQTGPVGPEETSGQWQLPLPVASYNMAFKTMFHEIAFPIDFILWHTTLVTFNTFEHISLILYEFGPPLWTMNRETWRKLRKASSLSGKRGISRCRKTRVFLCVCAPSTHYFCTAVLKRFKHQALSKRICRQLVRLPSLGLGRGVRCGQKIHGRLVTSFTIQKSFVKRIRVRPHCPCPVLLSPVTHHSKSITKAVTVQSCVFLGLLLLLAGDVESNPGPTKGKEREASVPEVLKEYEDEFFQVVHPKYNLLKLVRKKVITEDLASRISATTDDEGRELLYHHLKHHGSVQTLREFCEVAIAADGYPNIQKLAEKMLHAIPTDSSGNRQEYTSPPSAAPPNIRGCHPAGNIDYDGSSGPMSPWNDAALVSLRERLKLNVSMNTGLSDRLEKAAGGFMSEHEAKMVREPTAASNMEKIEKIIEILRGKTNEDFATFCTMLRETNHVVWADELEKEAEQFKRERKGVFGDGGRQEYMSLPTTVAPHIRGRPPGDTGYGLPPPTWASPFCLRQEVPYPHDVRQHVGQHSMVAPAPPTQPFTAATDSPGPSQRAEKVLDYFHEQFISDMDADAVVYNFLAKYIIDGGDLNRITQNASPEQKNQILHLALKRKCTDKALMDACDIITAVKNRRMTALGEAMRRALDAIEVVGGGGVGGEGQVESFFGQLRNFYRNMTIVEDEWLSADQSLQYVNLTLAPFKLDHHYAHEMFVKAVKEGVDNVYTYRSGKIQCEDIPKLAKKHKTVVVSGAPGVGKSTITRKVCKDICQAPDCHGYILVLLVELRDLLLFKKDFQLVDILQLFQGEMGDATTPVKLSKAISSNKGKDVLFILDGFDELPPHLRQSDFLVNLLSHNRNSPLRDCDVVLTSRSIVTSEIYHHMRESRTQVGLTNIEVLGFTRYQIKEYAGHYFKGQGRPDLLESFVSKIDAIPQVQGLCSIPVVLSIICQVFSFKQDLPPTLTEMYNDYMCIKVLKYYKDLTSLDSILDLPRDHDIYKLGEIAFNCIRSQKVVFQSSDLQGLGERFSDRIKGCGVLTARPVRADPKSKKAAIASFYFIHLTVQEFIAAVYVSLLPAEEQHEIWAKCLGKPHMAQVWRFFCGLTQLTHYELLQANITGYPEDFQMQCLFESQNASLVQKLMPHIVGEEVKVKPRTAYDSTAYGYCLSKHPALKRLRISAYDYSVEVHRLLEPVCASVTLQTLHLNQDDEDWRQVEDLFDRIRNCDGALKGHFGKVHLWCPPLSVAVKLLCLQHVREVECEWIQECETMDHEVLKEMEKALEGNKTLQKLRLTAQYDATLPKVFCRHLMIGIGLNTSLSEVNLNFDPISWDCPTDVPADIHRSVQHVTLKNVPVNVLPRLFFWFSQAKHFKCHRIHSPQEDEVGEKDVKFVEVEQALSRIGRLEKLVLGIGFDWSDSLMVEFGVSVLKVISGNKNLTHFVLYNRDMSDHSSTLSLTDYQLICRDSSSLTNILMRMDAPFPASAAQHQTIHDPEPLPSLPSLLTCPPVECLDSNSRAAADSFLTC